MSDCKYFDRGDMPNKNQMPICVFPLPASATWAKVGGTVTSSECATCPCFVYEKGADTKIRS